MTSNEKRVLIKFKEIKQANTVAIAGSVGFTIGYAGDVCRKLCEKGYLERLLPGQFAVYKITPLGEEQVKEEGASEKEIGVGVGIEVESKEEGEELYEYECTNCGASVKEDTTGCPRCGMIFEETVEEEEPTEENAEEQSAERAKQIEGQSLEQTKQAEGQSPERTEQIKGQSDRRENV